MIYSSFSVSNSLFRKHNKAMRVNLVACALAFCTAAAAQGPGMRPRPTPKDYAVSVHAPGMTIAASVLSKQEVRNSFAADLNKYYVVLEIAVYPDRDGLVAISPEDFMVKMPGDDTLVRPTEPAVVARAIQEQNQPKVAKQTPVDVVTETSVGYESGGYDPVTGQRRKGTWIVGSGVGVGTGGPNVPTPPKGPYSDNDRDRMEAELADKSLPEGPVTKPVAGYLYFPAGKKKGNYELKYLGPNGGVKLVVPPPTTH
jgi:hypothetical protein